MRHLVWMVLAGLMVLTNGAFAADCYTATADAEVKSCLAQELRDADQRINAVYKSVMDGRDEAGKVSLRDQQRAWLKTRDKACGLDNKESDREKWLAAVLTDQQKTVCVVRYTFQRVTEINALLNAAQSKALAADADAPKAPEFSKAPTPASAQADGAGFVFQDDGYQIATTKAHSTGKWYYEIWIDRGQIAALGDVIITPSFRQPQNGGPATMINMRHTHIEAPPVVIGMAIDLDNGAAYIRSNGRWNVEPGATGSLQVNLNRDYKAVVSSSSELTQLVSRGFVKTNFGDRPFDYALPDGYRPFNE